MAVGGQAGGCHRADIAKSEHCNLHRITDLAFLFIKRSRPVHRALRSYERRAVGRDTPNEVFSASLARRPARGRSAVLVTLGNRAGRGDLGQDAMKVSSVRKMVNQRPP
jgi:hypothetical protein